MKNKLYCTEEETENNFSSKENSSDNDQLNNSSDSGKGTTHCKCTSALCNNHYKNVITSSKKEVFFDIIRYIEDLNFIKTYLIALKETILNRQSNKEIIEPFNIKDTLNKFKE